MIPDVRYDFDRKNDADRKIKIKHTVLHLIDINQKQIFEKTTNGASNPFFHVKFVQSIYRQMEGICRI